MGATLRRPGCLAVVGISVMGWCGAVLWHAAPFSPKCLSPPGSLVRVVAPDTEFGLDRQLQMLQRIDQAVNFGHVLVGLRQQVFDPLAHARVLALPSSVHGSQGDSSKAGMRLIPLGYDSAGLRSFSGAGGPVGIGQELACVHGGFPWMAELATSGKLMQARNML